MSLTDQLGAPSANAHIMGKYTLHRYVRCEATAGDATAIAWANMSNIVSIDVDQPSYDMEVDVRHQGGGDEKRRIRRGPRWDGRITVLAGKVFDTLRLLKGITWTAAGTAALSLRQDEDNPDVIIESICRDSDNSTHLFTRVIQDIIIDDMGVQSPMDYSDREIPFHTYHEPFALCTGAEMVYHVWDATASTPTYLISTGSPLTLLTATDNDGWHFDNMVFCKLKDNSASDAIGKRLTTGVALSGGTLTFTTGTPAASDTVYALFAKAT